MVLLIVTRAGLVILGTHKLQNGLVILGQKRKIIFSKKRRSKAY